MGHTDTETEAAIVDLRRSARPPQPLGDAWTPHRFLATSLVVLSALIPAGLAVVVTGLIAQDWHRPGPLIGLVGYWLALAGVAYVVIRSAHLVTTRLLPLAALLRMGLAFPGAAPSRFRLALHAGNTRRLTRSPLDPDGQALGDAAAAGLMLELVTDLSNHDRATRGHSERVRAYTELLATELGVSADDRQRLRWAGLLHDIGKLEVPAEILNKPDRLTDDEFDIIRRHPLEGLRLAMPLWAWLGDFVLAVSDHHERWEGGGYPSGAAGTDISLAGRMVAVADAFDVMTSSRSYKAPVSADEARAELVRCSGTQFDPDVVRAFMAIDLDRLRAVIGPLAALAPLPALFRRIASMSTSARSAAGAATVATAVSAWAIVAPVLPVDGPVDLAAPTAPSGAPTGDAGAGSDRPGVLEPDATEVLDSIDPDGATGDDATDQGRSSGAEGTARPDRDRDPRLPGPTDPGRSGPADPGPGPGGSNPPPPADPPPAPDPEPVGIIIDPSDGSVAVDGVAPDGPVEIVGVTPVGQTVCGGAGVCDPIEVDLPVTLPRGAS